MPPILGIGSESAITAALWAVPSLFTKLITTLLFAGTTRVASPLV
jgi:hypothetical protein